ncbi:MAG: GNAT family N-acetyltransferase [Gemmatimonadaceae bacterium]
MTPPSHATFQIPHLTTDRLLLRDFRPEDFEPYAAMMAQPDVCRYLADGRPLSRADAWRQLAMFIGHWALRGYGLWAVEERATGRFIGRIGCLEPEGFPAFEIAYTLAPSAWGHGYALEGASAALRYARETLGRTRIASIIRPANNPSIRVAQSLGAVAGETVEFLGAQSIVHWYPSV